MTVTVTTRNLQHTKIWNFLYSSYVTELKARMGQTDRRTYGNGVDRIIIESQTALPKHNE